jgi:predicted nuclease of predicted toxin-antitoxin system
MSLTFYFDQHIPGPVARGLRRRGISVLTADEDGNKALDDESLLERATALGQVLVSNDEDFRRIAARWRSEGRPFAGLVAVTDQGAPHGKLIEDLLLVAEVYSAEEMVNRIEYLPY